MQKTKFYLSIANKLKTKCLPGRIRTSDVLVDSGANHYTITHSVNPMIKIKCYV